jgi:hypothetical protein
VDTRDKLKVLESFIDVMDYFKEKVDQEGVDKLRADCINLIDDIRDDIERVEALP